MSNPRLLLLDELSLGLAPVVIDALYGVIGEIGARGYDARPRRAGRERALAAADRAYCLLEGRISLQAPASELARERDRRGLLRRRSDGRGSTRSSRGVLLGGFYALFAAGLSLVFGVMRIVNLAHGDLSVLAAYIAVLLADHFGLNPFVSLAGRHPGDGGRRLSSCQLGLLNFTLDSGLAPLLATFGLAVIIQNALPAGVLGQRAGAPRRAAIETESIHVTSQISIGWFPLITLIAAVVVLLGLQVLLRRTGLGRALRATSDDQQGRSARRDRQPAALRDRDGDLARDRCGGRDLPRRPHDLHAERRGLCG